MTTIHITCEVEWQPRKLQYMLADIVIFLKQQGAKNPKSWVEGEEPEKPKLLTLECSECWAGKAAKGQKRSRLRWESVTFTACPKCGKRETVGKIVVPVSVKIPAEMLSTP